MEEHPANPVPAKPVNEENVLKLKISKSLRLKLKES